MAERIADNAEHIVDEMKRRARRRLVGAVILALGAAIVLPLLLEKEPRPLGDDVSVQIPPVDESKFVNRLTGKAGDSKALPKAETKAITPPAKSDVKPSVAAESAPASPPAAPTVSANDPPAPRKAITEAEPRPLPPAGDPAPKSESKAPAAVEPKAEVPAATTAVATPAAPTAATPTVASAATPTRTEGFVVQLAAFADDKGANALANKLKKSGYAAYVQPVETSRGTLWRVRVGGYASRPEADAARATLKGEGYSGIIAPAQ